MAFVSGYCAPRTVVPPCHAPESRPRPASVSRCRQSNKLPLARVSRYPLRYGCVGGCGGLPPDNSFRHCARARVAFSRFFRPFVSIVLIGSYITQYTISRLLWDSLALFDRLLYDRLDDVQIDLRFAGFIVLIGSRRLVDIEIVFRFIGVRVSSFGRRETRETKNNRFEHAGARSPCVS